VTGPEFEDQVPVEPDGGGDFIDGEEDGEDEVS